MIGCNSLNRNTLGCAAKHLEMGTPLSKVMNNAQRRLGVAVIGVNHGGTALEQALGVVQAIGV